MLTSARYGMHTLNLRVKESSNLFDIDSISLIIGPNGSGKSQFLKEIVEKFSSRKTRSFDINCQLSFNYNEQFSKSQIKDWGIIYYSPVVNRVTFKTQKGFIDASSKHGESLFNLAQHREIIEGFGLQVRLRARLRSGERKTHEFLTLALIEKGARKYLLSGDDERVQGLRQTKLKLERLSDFTDNQDEILQLQHTYKIQFSILSNMIKEDLLKISHQHQDNSEYFLPAFFATIRYLQEKTKSSFNTTLGFINRLGISSIFAIPQTSEEEKQHIHEAMQVFERTHRLLHTFNFEKTLDNVFEQEIDPIGDRHYFESRHGQTFEIFQPGMSSGQWAIFNQVICIHSAIERLTFNTPNPVNNILLLIDEGDSFLHLAWQRKYIWQLNRFLKNCKGRYSVSNLQLIIATHSPLLASDIPREFVCQLPAHGAQQSPGTETQPTFAAPLHAMLNRSFEASTIGEFATRAINKTIARLKSNDTSCMKEDDYLISIIDDPIIRRELERLKRKESAL